MIAAYLLGSSGLTALLLVPGNTRVLGFTASWVSSREASLIQAPATDIQHRCLEIPQQQALHSWYDWVSCCVTSWCTQTQQSTNGICWDSVGQYADKLPQRRWQVNAIAGQCNVRENSPEASKLYEMPYAQDKQPSAMNTTPASCSSIARPLLYGQYATAALPGVVSIQQYCDRSSCRSSCTFRQPALIQTTQKTPSLPRNTADNTMHTILRSMLLSAVHWPHSALLQQVQVWLTATTSDMLL